MAYDFFPKSAEEINKALKSHPKNVVDDIVNLFNYLVKSDPSPINIDKARPRSVNVNRKLDLKKGGKFTEQKIKTGAKLKVITIKFGNGSAGGRGTNNRGAKFETDMLRDIKDWWAGNVKKISPANLAAIEDMNRTYGLTNFSSLDVISEGSSNTKRPLIFSESAIAISNPKGSGLDVGASLTDITLVSKSKNKQQKVYLSLKTTTTVAFFNIGVRTILTPEEIKSGKITNPNGLRLLKLFGIDPVKFCGIFNQTTKASVDKKPKADIPAIKGLLKSGVGYGYHVLHDFKKTVISKKMDKKTMDNACDIDGNNIVVYYGGIQGEGRRIDIKFESPLYSFKLNIRDTQGKDGYPTRMMLDFTPK